MYSSLFIHLYPGSSAIIKGTAVTFQYYTQDYLGNRRAVVNSSTGAIEQTVAYYPYVGVIANLGTNQMSGQPYKFGGKELVTANGLYEYDFGARQYYSAVPGFTKPDPMAEKYYWLSPYLYCANNPVNFVDPTGNIIQMSSESSVSDLVDVLTNVQMITDDELFLSKQENGSFQIGISSFKDGKKSSGTRLVRRLNGSEKTLTIEATSEGVNQERSENPLNATNGIGTNTTIIFNPNFDPNIPEIDEVTGNVVNSKRPAYIGLAHEMIHADRGMRGVAFDYSEQEYHSFINNIGEVDVEYLPKEEAATIGFNHLDRIKSFNITENSIRKESGLRLRGAYKVYRNR